MPTMASQFGMGVLPFLSLVLPTVSQSIPGASLFKGGGIPGSGAYQLVDDYQPSVFFSKFNFYNSYDPTYGHVQYVNESVANTNGYATTLNDSVTISVDTTNKWPNGGPGRPAVRIISDNTYTHGLFVLDLSHMPYGCGTWPAFWLLGPDWPGNGEIDIIEGVHTSDSNTVSMHSSPNCTVAGSEQTGLFTNANCDSNANGNSGCGSMSNNTATPNNYGQGLSDNDGGVYITEWTSAYVRVWFFSRNGIPASITGGSPDVSEFGLPMANFQGSCDIDSHFANHSIIINTDFCGAWAGFAYSNFANCPLTADMNGYDSCVDFVGNNPQNFTQAYWEINSIKVYQLPVNVDPSSVPTSTAPLTSSSPVSISGSIINPGMGQSASSLPSSVPYTGPLSSVSSTVSSTATALATPLICFPYDGKTYTDYNGQNYTINCGYDLTGQNLNGNGQSVSSFEACIELCDSTAGCGGVTHVGGNGAGTCILKTGQGSLVYDGHTFVAVLASISSKASSTVSAAASSTTSLSSTPPKTATLRPTAQATTCPEANNNVYVDENVVDYNVYCSSDTDASTFNDTTIGSGRFTACFTICDVTPDCVGFTFEGASAGTCHFKNQFGNVLSAPSNFVVAFLSSGQNLTSNVSSVASTSSITVSTSVLPSLSASTSSVLASSVQSSTLGSSAPATSMTASSASRCDIDTDSIYTANIKLQLRLSIKQLNYFLSFIVRCISGGDISSPYRAASILDCLPSCDVTSGCIGVVYDTGTSSCQMKSTFTGTQVPGANFMIAARAGATDPGLSSSSSLVSSTSTPGASLSSASISSSATITITTLTGGGTYESPPVASATGGACSTPASGSVGTTTVFTTETVTACPTPGMCPQEGFGWGGTLFGSNFSSFSMAPQTISGGMGSIGNGGSGGSPTSTVIVTGSAPSNGASAVPVCPGSNGNIFTDSLGQVYEIGCGRLITDETISTSNVSSLTSCIDACDMYNIQNFNSPSGCLGVSFYRGLAAGNCELKTGSTNVTSPDADSARLLSRAVDPGNSTAGNGGTGGNGDYGSGSVVGTFTVSAPGGVTTVLGGGGSGTGNGGSGDGGSGNGNGAGTGPGTGPGSTVYAVSTAVSTIVSNGQTILSTYGVSTAVSVVYQPASTRTVTTTTVSISVSERTVVSTAPGQTVVSTASGGGGGQVITITAGGGNYITVTQVVTSYASPTS
ncbi:unnamed protein product, partial [Aureobasidium uvarum]